MFSGVLLLVAMAGCTVVKTPYFQTDYYRNTISSLEHLKPEIKQASDSVFAGFSKNSIIPDSITTSGKRKPGKIPIAGFGQLKTKYASGIHDSVFVRAIALKTGDQTNIIISAEMLIMPPNIIDSVLVVMAERGIDGSQLFFTATHTHSSIGGWGYGLLAKLMAGKRNPDIEKWLTMQIASTASEAMSDLKPAMIGAGSFEAPQFIRNRLTGNPQHNNASFDFIVAGQVNGKKGIIGIFSAHSTTIGRKNTLISGDYPGYWSRKVERSIADMAMFCSGSTGGQSPAGEGSAFESAAFIGESLADSVASKLHLIKMHREVNVSSMSLCMDLPEYHVRLTSGLNLTTRMSERLMPAPQNVKLQALKINNLLWFFTPGDFSGESALMLKANLAGKGHYPVITGYNGSYVGYILPGKYFYLDHYEPRMMGWFGPNMGDYTLELMQLMSGALINTR